MPYRTATGKVDKDALRRLGVADADGLGGGAEQRAEEERRALEEAAAARLRDLEAAAGDALDLGPRVLARVEPGAVLADALLSEVEAAHELADDHHVDPVATRRAEVRVQVKVLTKRDVYRAEAATLGRRQRTLERDLVARRGEDVLVLAGRGPMGSGMEETYQLTSALKFLPFGKHVALLTDARFSGVSTGAINGLTSGACSRLPGLCFQ